MENMKNKNLLANFVTFFAVFTAIAGLFVPQLLLGMTNEYALAVKTTEAENSMRRLAEYVNMDITVHHNGIWDDTEGQGWTSDPLIAYVEQYDKEPAIFAAVYREISVGEFLCVTERAVTTGYAFEPTDLPDFIAAVESGEETGSMTLPYENPNAGDMNTIWLRVPDPQMHGDPYLVVIGVSSLTVQTKLTVWYYIACYILFGIALTSAILNVINKQRIVLDNRERWHEVSVSETKKIVDRGYKI
jgi:hypothetical protein